MKVQISLSLLMVALDALYGSLQIADRGDLFRYTKENREKAMNVLDKILRESNVEIEVG